MPELPEVELLARFLRRRLADERILRLEIGDIAAVKTVLPDLAGRTIAGVERFGKWIGLDVGGSWVCFHLSRAGWLRWFDEVPVTMIKPGRSPIALRVRLESGAGFDLTEAGTKKRLAVYVVAEPGEVPQIASLGIEPLSDEFTLDAFTTLLRAKNAQVKGVLRDQHLIAGIGNAYSDEVLHAARLSPFALTRKLSDDAIAALYEAIGSTLNAAIDSATEAGATAPHELKDSKRSAMRVHGRAGQECGICADTVREVSFADSALQYCPTCQTGGKPLADRRMSRLLK